jgi:hypothetical protein
MWRLKRAAKLLEKWLKKHGGHQRWAGHPVYEAWSLLIKYIVTESGERNEWLEFLKSKGVDLGDENPLK